MKPQVIAKWGNSLGIRVPGQVAKQINLHEGTSVTLTIVESSLLIKPDKKKYTLSSLLLKHCSPAILVG